MLIIQRGRARLAYRTINKRHSVCTTTTKSRNQFVLVALHSAYTHTPSLVAFCYDLQLLATCILIWIAEYAKIHLFTWIHISTSTSTSTRIMHVSNSIEAYRKCYSFGVFIYDVSFCANRFNFTIHSCAIFSCGVLSRKFFCLFCLCVCVCALIHCLHL